MNRSEKGFTLIEFIFVIAIIGIISISVYNAFFGGVKVFNFTQEKINFQQIQRVILSSLSPYIKETKIIDLDPPDNDKLRIYFNKKKPTSDPDDFFDGLAYGITGDGEFYYRKRWTDRSSTPYWGNRVTITEPIVKEVSFAFDKNLVTINVILVDKTWNKEYSFSDSFYIRSTGVTTP